MKGQILRATLGNLERRTTRGSSWKTFDLAGEDSAHLEKITKRKGSQKAKFEKVKVWKHWRKRD